MINLSRNIPVAFVVGAAGFIGSHVAEKLINLGIQVVGVDDLSTGSLDNLNALSQNPHFHFLKQSASEALPEGLPRMDYAFFLLSSDIDGGKFSASFENFLNICQGFKPKILLLSSIELYDQELPGFNDLRLVEGRLAKVAAEKQLNARIVRLSAVYGQRMHFRANDPIVKLIKSKLEGQIEQSAIPLDFTTRALYIKDAVDLIIRAQMLGNTYQKIYDGELPAPIKITEIRQILLDPLWYENKGFVPTKLPPWVTPNFNKTIAELSWIARENQATALRETLRFFQQGNIPLWPQAGSKPTIKQPVKDVVSQEPIAGVPPAEPKKVAKQSIFYRFTSLIKSKKAIFLGCLIILAYSLFWPAYRFVDALYAYESNLGQIGEFVNDSDFLRIRQLNAANTQKIEDLTSSKEIVSFLNNKGIALFDIDSLDKLIFTMSELNLAIQYTAEAGESFKRARSGLIGESTEKPEELFKETKFKLEQANKKLSFLKSQVEEPQDAGTVVSTFDQRRQQILRKASELQKRTALAENLVFILSEIATKEGKSSYLVLMMDSSVLKPGGGLINSYAQVDLEQGRVTGFKTGASKDLDNKYLAKVEEEIKAKKSSDIDVLSLASTNLSSDFITNSKAAQAFYFKATGNRVDGVIGLDLNALTSLIAANSSGEKDKDKLLDKILNSDDPEYLNGLFKHAVEDLIFSKNFNWVEISQAVGEALQDKHLMIYIFDSVLVSHLNSLGWSGEVPGIRNDKKGERGEYFWLSENSTGTAKVNYFIRRDMKLESHLGADGVIRHQLTVAYRNDSQANSRLAGDYKYRLKLNLSPGTRISKALWESADLTKQASASGTSVANSYTFDLNLAPGEGKVLEVEFSNPKPAIFEDDKLRYRLNFYKQPGTGNDSIAISFSTPPVYQIKGVYQDGLKQAHPRITTDLSRDRSFEYLLQKP